jgi:Zn-finger nucleic acid-binding protein
VACCPACQGVWIGCGELGRLLEQARGEREGQEAPAAPPRRPGGPGWPQEIEFYDFG